jgi:cyclophilin family peptidyl-prolyl cis-trans isomerase
MIPGTMGTDKRQRQKAGRQQRLAEQRKANRRAQLRRRLIQFGALAVIVVAVLAFSSWRQGRQDAAGETTNTSTPTSTTVSESTVTTAPVAVPAGYEDYRAQPTACGAEAPTPRLEMQFDAPEDQGVDPDDTVTATIVTSCGDLVIDLDPAAAPETVNSFVFLARQGYFDGVAFHRIVEDFMAQVGDPTATGGGGPGYVIPDELPEAGFVYERGVVAMANRGPGTSGSQFFIMFGDTFPLGPSYSVFGTLVNSDATLDAIEAIPTALRGSEQSVPLETVYIERIDVEVTPAS